MAWLVRRLIAAVAIVFAVATLPFTLIHLAPGPPFLPGDERTLDPAVVAALRAQFGLDQPLPVQYAKYLGALVHGDLGVSFRLRRPVADVLAATAPNTLLLSGAALAIDFLLGAAIGLYQAARARRRADVVLGNATLPLITLFGLALPFLLTGAVLVETVFSWPGMGKLAADAIFGRDYPVVVAAALLASAMVVLGSLLADLLYAVVDPRIRLRGSGSGEKGSA